MKILAMSDIHDNVPAVRKLRRRESNSYDIIIVAGDIGTQNTSKIFEILTTYDCPIIYVYGNWDNKLSYETQWSPNGFHLDLKLFRFGQFNLVGFSGHWQNWGCNPIYLAHLQHAEKQIAHVVAKLTQVRSERLIDEKTNGRSANPQRKKLLRKGYRLERKKRELEAEYLCDIETKIETLHRNALNEVLESVGEEIRNTIVVTHERLWRFHERIVGVPLFLFGHKHEFQDTIYKGSRFVNVAALGDVSWIHSKERDQGSFGFNDGTYVSLEVLPNGQISVESRNLGPIPNGFVDSFVNIIGEYNIHPEESDVHSD
jgi:Calcineurin-like phosphoesterase superfamily domain